MKTFSPFRLILILLSVIFFGSLTSLAQGDSAREAVEPSYEVVLQLIVGSSDGAGSANLPQSLRSVAGQIRSDFGFSNYRLDNTFVGRIGTNGTFDYKSLSNSLGSAPDPEAPSFLEWSLGRLRKAANDKGQAAFMAEPFRFGARLPIRVSTVVDGKAVLNTSYESVGLTVNRVSLSQNTPTLIGTLSLPRTAGTIFLVLTVRPTE